MPYRRLVDAVLLPEGWAVTLVGGIAYVQLRSLFVGDVKVRDLALGERNYLDLTIAVTDDIKLSGSSPGEVYHELAAVWSSVCYSNNHFLSVSRIPDQQFSPKGVFQVCTNHAVLVVAVAVTHLSPVETIVVI